MHPRFAIIIIIIDADWLDRQNCAPVLHETSIPIWYISAFFGGKASNYQEFLFSFVCKVPSQQFYLELMSNFVTEQMA